MRLQRKSEHNSEISENQVDMALMTSRLIDQSQHIQSNISSDSSPCGSHVITDDSSNSQSSCISKMDTGQLIGPVMVSILKTPATTISQESGKNDHQVPLHETERSINDVVKGCSATPINMQILSKGQTGSHDQNVPQKKHALLWLKNTNKARKVSHVKDNVTDRDAFVPDFTPIKEVSTAIDPIVSMLRIISRTPLKILVHDTKDILLLLLGFPLNAITRALEIEGLLCV